VGDYFNILLQTSIFIFLVGSFSFFLHMKPKSFANNVIFKAKTNSYDSFLNGGQLYLSLWLVAVM